MKAITTKAVYAGLLAVLLATPVLTFGADAPVKTTAVEPKVPGKRRVVKIQLNEATAVGAQKGWFKEEFDKLNADVQFVNVAAIGISGAEASMLDRGDLHITSRMAYPALQHKVNGLDAVVIWMGQNPNPRRAVTFVLADSPIKSVDDLSGKSFGSSLIGCPYYAGREAIKAKGHDVDTEFQKGDIRFVNITGVAGTAAFLSGKLDAYGTHPAIASVASLYTSNQVREITTAVPNGIYVTAGGRSMYFAMRKWSQENPDLVQAFLKVLDKTQRWIIADHYDEAAAIASRETREPKHVALYDLKNESRIVISSGQNDYDDAVQSIEKFQNWAISVKDPFYTKHHLTDKQIEAFVDKRFFKGGEYFVDGDWSHPAGRSQASLLENSPVKIASTGEASSR